MDTLAFPGKVFISVKTNPEEAKWCLRYILIYSLIFVGLRWKNGLLIRKKDGEYYYLSWWTLYSSMSPLSVKVKSIHSYERGKVRDLNYLGIQITLGIGYRTVKGPWCVHLVEELDLEDWSTILSPCVHTSLQKRLPSTWDWETVKAIHEEYLEIKFSQRVDENPRLLTVDEIAVRKGHPYLIIILNW